MSEQFSSAQVDPRKADFSPPGYRCEQIFDLAIRDNMISGGCESTAFMGQIIASKLLAYLGS
ncbi:hypothetical protein [Nocardia fluminea]|uniref:hypothetical protein n=1 Tax=Nocardia fluminea TaxID=134984 RepID=UPI00117DB9A2|nr:hypothetical protein [Nocardia fluminea]